ncbi:MAG TPA: hypothetical protein VGI45_01500 [Terracidiphilus sp.]|jgi:hypothetical protein
MNTHLDHKHELLLESLLSGSLPRNLHWDDVVELIGKVGTLEPHGGAEFAFVVGSQRAFFKRPSTHSLEVNEVSRLRRFLHEAGLGAVPGKPVQLVRVIVVIDHHLARVYQDLDGSRPQSEDAVRPYDPHGFHRHLIHRKETHYQGQRAPEEPSFYEEVAKDLEHSQQIVLIGHGTGKSSALEFLEEYLKKHHAPIYERVIATEIADLSALTEPEIEAIAKKHM